MPGTTTEAPVYAVSDEHLIPTSDHLTRLATTPPSRMFLIKQGLAAYREAQPGSPTFDASQGDGGASLPGVPADLLEEAAELQIEHGTSYDMPFGTNLFRQSVAEDYWKFDSASGLGPQNVIATVGGRDGLEKAYTAMLNLGYGRQGDAVAVTRVPWISYNWGPYGVGANVVLAPGDPAAGWAYTPDSIHETAAFVEQSGRKLAGIVITSPDNPTGNTLSADEQESLARAALEAGAAFVLFDWMYHTITEGDPMDLNAFAARFSPEERERLIFMDGLTKSLGASNIRIAHLVAPERVAKFITARASHAVIPPFYGQAVAIAAYRKGFREAADTIISPINESRRVLRGLLEESGVRHILGKGYYAFIDVGPWLREAGMEDTEPLGAYLAEKWGVAVVPGAFFSRYGGDWVRFSYATPAERTKGAFERMMQGLEALAAGGGG